MKKFYRVLLIAVFIFIVSSNAFYANAESFEIEDYQVNIVVNENGILEIEEIISADFMYERHGILREIPLNGTLKRKIDGVLTTSNYKISVYDVDVEDNEFLTYKKGNNIVIRIGDYEKMVIDKQVYKISYKVYTGGDTSKVIDELYYSIIGTGWDLTIQHVSASIRLPKSFDESKVYPATGYAGATSDSGLLYYIENNTVYIESERPLPPHNGINLRIELENDYFSYEEPEKQPIVLDSTDYVYAAMAGIVLIILAVWFTFGKSPKLYPEIRMHPPYNMTPAEMGYVFDGRVDDKDIVSLFVYWASKGYIKIEKTDKTFADYQLTKLADTPDFENKYESELFFKIFESKLDKDKQEKEVYLNHIKTSIYTTILSVKAQVINKFKDNEEGGIYTKISVILKKILLPLCAVSYLLTLFKITVPLKDVLGIYGSTFAAGTFLLYRGFKNFNEAFIVNIRSNRFGSLTFALLSTLYIIVPYYFMSKTIFTFTYDYTLICAVLVTITIYGFFAANMEKPTEETSRMREQIIGFKNYIKNSEVNSEDDCNTDLDDYFSSILCYAYVLDLTDVWINKFENVLTNAPAWYIENGLKGRVMPRFGRSFNSMERSMTSGVSSGGMRGGASGGGMGGGGGGSW